MSVKKLSERPAKVVYAVNMLYLVVVVGAMRTVMTVIRHAGVRSPYFLIFTQLLIYVGLLFLIYQVDMCKNWARWSLIVVFTICIPLTIIPLFESISYNPVHTILGFLQLGLYIVSLFFLFHKSSSSWYCPPPE